MADFLRTNYVDDVLDTSKNTRRKYNMIQNSDGTVSFEDVTEYKQVGDSYGSVILNAQNTDLANIKDDISELNSNKFDKSGGTVTGDIKVKDKLLLYSNGEGGNIRVTSPNDHQWEMDAYQDTCFRLYHGTSNTEADQGFCFNSKNGRISSDSGTFAFLEEVNSKQNALGYTPVQQGGGTDQYANKVYMGWNSSYGVKLQIDTTDMGAIVTNGAASPAILSVAKGGTGATSGMQALANLGLAFAVSNGVLYISYV